MPNGTYGGVRGRRNFTLLDLSLFRWTDLREDFKEVLTDLFCVIAVGLADEPDCIRQKDVALIQFQTETFL
jgi:hypothetical protein